MEYLNKREIGKITVTDSHNIIVYETYGRDCMMVDLRHWWRRFKSEGQEEFCPGKGVQFSLANFHKLVPILKEYYDQTISQESSSEGT